MAREMPVENAKRTRSDCVFGTGNRRDKIAKKDYVCETGNNKGSKVFVRYVLLLWSRCGRK